MSKDKSVALIYSPIKAKPIPLGGIGLIDKAEKDLGLFSRMFRGISTRVKDFEARVKLVYRLTHAA